MADGAVILLSGGLDSSTLLHHLRRLEPDKPIHALTFHYGQRHARELDCAAWQATAVGTATHQILALDVLHDLAGGASALIEGDGVPALAEIDRNQLDQPPTYVPNRNLLLLSLAAAYAEAQGIADVFYAAQHQDCYGYWDCTEDFLQRLNHLLALNRRTPIKVNAPFAALNKTEVLQAGLRLGVDYSHTWTCYRGESKACGICPACVERLAAFRQVGENDPLIYAGHSPR